MPVSALPVPQTAGVFPGASSTLPRPLPGLRTIDGRPLAHPGGGVGSLPTLRELTVSRPGALPLPAGGRPLVFSRPDALGFAVDDGSCLPAKAGLPVRLPAAPNRTSLYRKPPREAIALGRPGASLRRAVVPGLPPTIAGPLPPAGTLPGTGPLPPPVPEPHPALVASGSGAAPRLGGTTSPGPARRSWRPARLATSRGCGVFPGFGRPERSTRWPAGAPFVSLLLAPASAGPVPGTPVPVLAARLPLPAPACPGGHAAPRCRPAQSPDKP